MAAQLPDAEEIAAIVRRELRAALAELRQVAGADAELSAEEAARLLGVSPKTVRRWAREGRVQGTRRGRAWSFTRAGLASPPGTTPEAAAVVALAALPR